MNASAVRARQPLRAHILHLRAFADSAAAAVLRHSVPNFCLGWCEAGSAPAMVALFVSLIPHNTC